MTTKKKPSSNGSTHTKSVGEIWLATVVFTDDPSKNKKRPILIVGENQMFPIDIQVTPVSAQSVKDADFDVPIQKWQAAGLKKPSVAKVFKTFPTTKTYLHTYIGRLESEDLVAILNTCKGMYEQPGLVD